MACRPRKAKTIRYRVCLEFLQGSAEALCASLEGMSGSLVSVKAVQAGLGPISMADVDMAVGMEGTILGFNVKNSNNAVINQAKQKGIAILRNNVIYHVIQEVLSSKILVPQA